MTAPASDDGLADPRLARALAAYGREPTATRLGEAHAALAAARVYVPTVQSPERAVALITLRASDGGSAVPAFSSIPALLAWRADARPVPAQGAEALAAAVEEGHEAVVLDIDGPVRLVVDGAALRSLAVGYLPVAGAAPGISARVAEGRPELRAARDPLPPEVVATLHRVLPAQQAVTAAWALDVRLPGGTWQPALALALRPDLAEPALAATLHGLADALGDALGPAGLSVLPLRPDEQPLAERCAEPLWRRSP